MASRTAAILHLWRTRTPVIPHRVVADLASVNERTSQRWFRDENAGDKMPISALRAMEAMRPGLVRALFPEAFRGLK